MLVLTLVNEYCSQLPMVLAELGGCNIMMRRDPVGPDLVKDFDFVVSYRYRHILSHDTIQAAGGRVVNLHISLLPWNRGADPNLWSFLEDTPKGVSIHYVDDGIDTGPIVCQRPVSFRPGETLATTYDFLNDEVLALFRSHWPWISKEGCRTYVSPQPTHFGSSHRKADKEPYMKHLTEGWNTPVDRLVGLAKPKPSINPNHGSTTA